MSGSGIRSLAAVVLSAALLGSVGWAAVVSAAEEMAASEMAVSIPAESHDIPGVLAMPSAGEGPFPAVLMLHGYGSDKHEVGLMYTRLAEALAAQGVASLRIDFAGMGESQASMLDYTYDSQIGDAATALDWLVAQESIDPDYDGDQFFYDQTMLADCKAAGGQVELDLGWRTIQHSCDLFSSMMASTALTDLAPYAGPMLLIVATEDTSVDPSVSENAARSTASDDVTLEIIEGADHIYDVLSDDQTLAEQAIATTADWYAEKL